MDVWITASSKRNPYMALLTEHLRRRGLDVEAGVEPQGTIATRALTRGLPDILHLHWLNIFFLRNDPTPLESALTGGWMTGSLGLFSAAQSSGTRIVWTAHNLGNHENRMKWADAYFHREIARMADGIIAHSRHAKSKVVEEFDLQNPDKIDVIPHGNYLSTYPNEISANEARRELGLPQDVPVLLFVGLIRPYKNVPRLVETFSTEFPDAEARLVVAGSASSDALERNVRDAAATDPRVQLHLEYIPDEDLQIYLNAADAVVLPYRDILTSGSAVLAMSFGRPIVAPNIGTIRDVVEEEGGYLYDADRPDGLAGALERTLEADPDEREAIGRRNLERAQGWDWPGVARQTHELYERVVRR